MATDPRSGVDFLRRVQDAESENRALAIEDLKFRYGDQWPQYAVASRGMDRPQLTINEVDGYCRKVINSIREQRPRINPHPTGMGASVKTAKVIKGLIRHIEVNSSADTAYDTGADWGTTIGWGYWRVDADYESESSFNQELYVRPIWNPFTVYFDPKSMALDGSDANEVLVTDLMRHEDFKAEYPGTGPSISDKAKSYAGRVWAGVKAGFSERGSGDVDPDWLTKDHIRVAERFWVERVPAELVALSNGSVLYGDDFRRVHINTDVLASKGLMIVGTRQSVKRAVKWCKQTAFEILDERTIPGRWIPIVPVYGVVAIIDGKRQKMGLVRFAKDPQRMVNFWQTAYTELVALGPKPKWLMAEGQDETHESEWRNANNSPTPVLRYKPTDVNGQPAPPPQRIAPEPPPQGALEAAFMASQNLQRVLGIFDPGVRPNSQHKSDKTLQAERSQSEVTNYHFYDNLTISIAHTGRIILNRTPTTYDTQRLVRIIKDDGKPDLVTINERTTAQDETGQAILRVLNDVTVGQYDVVMETGPGYDTKRQEGVAGMIELMATPVGEEVAKVGADLLVRMMDFPGADVLADRMAAANPLAQIDENDEIPPRVQMMVKALQQQLQQAQGMLQQAGLELKYRANLEQMKQEGETKRELLKQTTKAHDIETIAATREHDVETKALTAQNVAEINGLVQLLVKHIDTAQLEKELAARNAEQEAKAAEATPATA